MSAAEKASGAPKKVRILRLKAFIPWILLTAIIAAGYLLFFDSLVKRGLEASGTALNGAKVEIAEFDFRLLDTAVVSSGIAWTDPDNPMKNLFEIGATDFTLDTRPLTKKKFYVTRMAVENLRFDTDRKTSGAIESKPEKKATGGGSGSGEATSSGDNLAFGSAPKKVDVNDIVSEEDIPVIRMAKDLESRIKERQAYWEKRLPEVTDFSELERVSKEVEAISKRSYRLPRDLPQIQQDIETLKRAEKLVKEKEAELKEARRMLRADIRMLQSDYDNVTGLREANLRELLIDQQDNPFSARNILSAIIGSSLIDTADKYLGYYEKAKGYLPEKKKTEDVKVVKKERALGTTVDFVKVGALPSVFIERIDLSGQSGPRTTLSGTVLDASSDLTYKPLAVDITFHDTERDFDIATLEGTVAGAEEGISSLFTLNITRSPLSQLSEEIENAYVAGIGGTADIVATLDETPERRRVTVHVEGKNVSFDLKEGSMGRDLERLLKSVLAEIPLMTVDLEVVSSGGRTKSNLKSNLEPILNARLKAFVDAEVARINRQIKERFNAEVQKALEPVRKELNRLDKSGTLSAALNDANGLDAARAKLEAELEKRVKDEEDKAKDKVNEELKKQQDKLEDQLKKLF